MYNQRPHFVVVAALSSLYPVREATTYGLAVVPYGVLRDGEWGAKGPSKRQVKENSSLLREYRCGLHAKTVKRSYSEPVFLGKPVNATYLRGGVVELMANARRDVKGMVVDL